MYYFYYFYFLVMDAIYLFSTSSQLSISSILLPSGSGRFVRAGPHKFCPRLARRRLNSTQGPESIDRESIDAKLVAPTKTGMQVWRRYRL
jgi:hypothetical protein